MLELQKVTRRVGGETCLENISFSLQRGELAVLLGPTRAGKTSLMRLMAGLDKPDTGDICFDGKSVRDIPVQKRNVTMVYQQFINYPSLNVYENIASPLVVAGIGQDEIRRRVNAIAELLHLTALLQRRPAALSGGQQQRVALARALVKGADLVLLDEPLANLDYKLREELRAELPRLFADTGAVLIYATTEPSEALVLAGKTLCLQEGRLIEAGPTAEVYRRPVSLLTAQLFSDPPLNTAAVRAQDGVFCFRKGAASFRLGQAATMNGEFTIGIRPHCLHTERVSPDAIEVAATVAVTELSGSESYVHFDFMDQRWVALLHGIHNFAPFEQVRFHVRPEHVMLFAADQQRIDTGIG